NKRLETVRCPFASVDKCPRFYQSLSLLSTAGHTAIEPSTDKKLLKKWKCHDLWPVTDEQATSIMGPPGKPNIFSRFCPEVSYEAFGVFTSAMSRFSDETDAELRHEQLARVSVPTDDWRWSWSQIKASHYSECPLFAPLSQEKATTRVDRIISWAKNNVVISVIIVSMPVLAAIAASTKDFSTLLDVFKGEHGVLVVKKIGSGDVSSYDVSRGAGEATVQFEPKDSRQRLQQITIELPKELSLKKEVVFPPLGKDLSFEMGEMNVVLQAMIPRETLPAPYHRWLTEGTIPVALIINYLNSSGEARTENLLYEADFGYWAIQDCDRGCLTDVWSISLRNIRYVRPMSWREEPSSLVAKEMAKRRFVFEKGY
ncbi:MAG: hypothetical protein WA869_19880, partial [Alloacidobacterium sp.]